MKKFALITLCFLAPFFALADYFDEMAAYEPGKSTAWFFQMRADSIKGSQGKKVEEGILAKLGQGKLSVEAFRLACEILKPVASDSSIPVLAKFLGDDNYSAPACDVLLGINSAGAYSALEKSFASAAPSSKMNILSTLAAGGKGLDLIADAANSSDRQIALFAIGALGTFTANAAEKALSAIVRADDFRKDAATEALVKLAWRAYCDGKSSIAKRAVNNVSEDFPLAVRIRGELSKDRQKYFDAVIIEGGPNVAAAGRAMNMGRKFEASEALVAAFPNLSKESKLAAIGSFIEARDARYFRVIAPEMDSSDVDIKAEAVYAARFLAPDEASIAKIYETYKKGEKPYSELAQKVLEENPSLAASKILKEKSADDLNALKILVKRGDIAARKELWSRFFKNDGWKNGQISSAVDDTIAYGELPAFASEFKKTSNAELRNEMAKIIIKKLARSRDKGFIKKALEETLKGNLDGEDSLAVMMKSKLDVLEKQTGQPNYGNSVDDRFLTIATEKEPAINSTFVSLFNGKNLDGWKTSTGSATYSVVDGCILGVTDPKMKHNSFLVTERSDYKNFIFSCEFKWTEFGNSGVMFRGQRRNDQHGGVYGPQAEIDDSQRGWTAGIYHEGGPWKYSVSHKEHGEVRKAVKRDDWNRLTIKCVGDRMQTWLNGVPVADLLWGEFKEGFFGLQIHSGPRGSVMWKNIVVKELK